MGKYEKVEAVLWVIERITEAGDKSEIYCGNDGTDPTAPFAWREQEKAERYARAFVEGKYEVNLKSTERITQLSRDMGSEGEIFLDRVF